MRWLLMVVGCAVLETAQPMSAAPAPDDGRTVDTVIYPVDAAAPTADHPGGSGGTWLFAAAVFCATGAFFYWRKTRDQPSTRRATSLVVEETRALGNRQFLVVAVCQGQRFLLGVAPGSIQLLAPLGEKDSAHARPLP
jgi:flagellar protein FliO/FliZ